MFRPTVGERLNTITHALGLLLSVVGSAVLLSCAMFHGDGWRSMGCGVYAAALVGVYASSTLSHSASHPRWKRLFRMLDQAFIYLLIVGTYTPFALTYLRSGGWMLFLGLMWTVAAFGFLSKVLMAYRVETAGVWTYLFLGWMPVVSAARLSVAVPAIAMWWLLFGGICYSLGTIFLMNDQRIPHFHAVWHLFVILGSVFHFFAILQGVAITG